MTCSRRVRRFDSRAVAAIPLPRRAPERRTCETPAAALHEDPVIARPPSARFPAARRPERTGCATRVALGAAFALPIAFGHAATDTATIEVILSGLPNDDGEALFALFAGAEGFPDRVDAAAARRRGRVVGGVARVVFEDVAPGDYALSALHDANGSGAIDTNLLGLPTEKFGVSNVAKGRPTWDAARFAVAGDAGTIIIELAPLRYF